MPKKVAPFNTTKKEQAPKKEKADDNSVSFDDPQIKA